MTANPRYSNSNSTPTNLGPLVANTRYSGFSLLELIIVIAVGAILVGLAAPNFSNIIKNNRVENRANDLIVGLNLARQSAISRNQVAFICHSNNAEAATPACNGGTDSSWSSGYIIYHPPLRALITTERAFASGTDVIVKQVELDEGQIITTQTNALSFLTFGADGTLFNNGVSTFTVCDDRTGEAGKQITVSPIGRISTTDINCT